MYNTILMEKKITPIDTHIPVKKIWTPLSFVLWIGSFLMTATNRTKRIKRNKLPKPPYLLLSTHASMMDFYQLLMATFPHRPYWISTVEEFVDKYWLFNHIGVIAKRKFTNDPKSAMIYLDILKNRKKILIIFPEARYSLVGEEERIDASLGRFVKAANVPVVLAKSHGNYLYTPQWSDRKNRKVRPIMMELETIVDKYEAETLSAEDIQQIIVDHFHNSEEEWMRKKNIHITYKDRAVGLHKLLYKCPHCGTEFEMSSESHFLKCEHCGVIYDYEETGSLRCMNRVSRFNWPSEWYKWEKEEVKKEVLDGTYHFEDDVRVEKLIGAKVGFVPQEGTYHLTHTIEDGIIVKGVDNDFEFHRPSLQSFAIHIEYNYMNRGAFLDLATADDSYFVYPLNKPLYITKIHFAVEHIYDMLKEKLKKEEK